MKTIKLLEKLKQKPVIKIQDIERITQCNRKYAKTILNRLKRKNYINKVTKNIYTMQEDIYVIASNITFPSYISFWSASNFLGYTEQIVNTVQIATTRKVKPIKFKKYNIKFIPIKPFFGYKKINTKNGEIFIVENEKLMIDAFLKPKEFGNFDEIKKIFELDISKEKMRSYLKKIKKQTVAKRVGYLLEKIKNIDLSKSLKLDRNYLSLNPFEKKWKKTNTKWRIRL